jgi:ketosteroid isomerase-like protein
MEHLMADGALLQELNRDVWHAFRAAYSARDAVAFLALNTPDLVRAGGPERQVHGFAEYAAQIEQWFAELTERGDGIGIDFRFVERIAADGLASERGVFRITVTPATGDGRVFYGQFHTFARKAGGRWRIAVDYDTNEGGAVTAESFAAATDIDDVAPFAG